MPDEWSEVIGKTLLYAILRRIYEQHCAVTGTSQFLQVRDPASWTDRGDYDAFWLLMDLTADKETNEQDNQ